MVSLPLVSFDPVDEGLLWNASDSANLNRLFIKYLVWAVQYKEEKTIVHILWTIIHIDFAPNIT